MEKSIKSMCVCAKKIENIYIRSTERKENIVFTAQRLNKRTSMSIITIMVIINNVFFCYKSMLYVYITCSSIAHNIYIYRANIHIYIYVLLCPIRKSCAAAKINICLVRV